MSQTNDGGPAFPHLDLYTGAGNPQPAPVQYNGMTLRDWFAGQALAGMLSDHEVDVNANTFASISYDLADAMLAERAKERA